MAAGVQPLWVANLKINTDEHGFNFKYWIGGGVAAADARGKAVAVANAYKAIMPQDADIYFATISKDNREKDSLFLPEIVGKGLWIGPDPAPTTSSYDYSKVAVKVRFEHEGGASVTRKVNPIPDEVVHGGVFLGTVDPVLAPVTAQPRLPALVAPATTYTWYQLFNQFLQVYMYNTVHVPTKTRVPGTSYVQLGWTAAHVLGVRDKKGGRVFSS